MMLGAIPGGTTTPTAATPTAAASGTAAALQSGAAAGSSGVNFFGVIPTNAPSALGGATAAGPNTNTPIFPGTSLSPFYLATIGSSTVNLGAGLPGGGSMSIDQAVNWFDALPAAQLLQVESLLWSAGYYTDANGNPLKTAPVLGTLDDQGRRAFLNSLISAYSSGSSVTDTINEAIQSGQGANLRSTLPSAVMGGGNVYTIDLTQPGAVNEVANAVFQAALGRNATSAEENSITQAVNSGTIAQGLAKQTGAEQASVQQYQTRVNQRNIQYQFETTPKTALGAVPNAPIANAAQYATTLLGYMGLPVTAGNTAFIMGWIQATGSGLTGMNPLGSQNAVPGSTPNTTGTPTYTSWEQSLQATAAALNSGAYANILSALQQSNAGSLAASAAVQSELKKWSGGAFSNITTQVKASQTQANLAAFYAGNTAQAANPAANPSPITQAQAQNLPGYADFLKSGGTPEQWLAAQQQNQNATAAAAVTPPGVPAGTPTTPAADVTAGQQQSNPGDQYVNPTTVFSQNPLSPEQASYLEATTGPNRFSFAENNFLHSFLAVANMISAGHPTGT